jgi:hypothetical protein
MPDLDGYVLALLRKRIGTERAISVDRLAADASIFYGNTLNEREVRQIVHDLRFSGEPICSGPSGFYWPDTLQDVLVCADHEFRSAARSMLLTARKLRQAGKALFGGQGRLL